MSLHGYIGQLFIYGHDLWFGKLVHSHFGVDADLGTYPLGGVVANAKNGLCQSYLLLESTGSSDVAGVYENLCAIQKRYE